MAVRKSSLSPSQGIGISNGTAIILVLIGIVSVQAGAGIAKGLFDQITPTTMVWLRLMSSAVLLMALARPRLTDRSARDWWVVVGFGLTLATMNWAIYQSMSRIPIGIAVTIEFIGPLAVAAAGFRRPRDLGWVGLAGIGVILLGAERADLDLVGVLFALLAGAAWASYILLSAHTGKRWDDLDGLAVASLVAVGALSPLLLWTDLGALSDGRLVLLGAAVGVLSSVVPYSCELIALRRMSTALLGVLMSMEPAAAALVGVLLLDEHLGIWQWTAIVCVVVASVGATHAARRTVRIEPPPG